MTLLQKKYYERLLCGLYSVWACPQVLLIVCTVFCCDNFFFVTAVVYSRSWDFYMLCVNIFLLWNQIMLILPDKYFKTVFEWVSIT